MAHGHKTRISKCDATGKTGFGTWDAAMTALRRIESEGGRVYHCANCGMHHFTRWSEADHVNSMAKQAAAVEPEPKRPGIPAVFLNSLRKGVAS